MAAIVTVKVEALPQEVDSPDAGVEPLSELTDTQVQVWRADEAVLVAPGIYRLVGTISEDEKLQFKTGNAVRCDELPKLGLIAIELFI